MPWCPDCSYEYTKGTKKCPDCGISLKNAPGNNELRMQNKGWSTIRQVTDPFQADLIKNFLVANGFKVITQGGNNSTIVGKGSVINSVRIYVPTETASAAAALLRSSDEWTEESLAKYMKDHGELVEEDVELYLDEEAEYYNYLYDDEAEYYFDDVDMDDFEKQDEPF